MAINYQSNANPGRSSSGDPRGRLQNQSQYQQNRFEQQQGPAANQFALMTGRSNESDYGNYTDIMNQYRDIYSGGGSGGGGGGGVSDGGFNAMGMYTPFTVSPGRAGYSDPFKSYGGMEEFSKTGGYSKEDIANMRARSVSPIRAAYGNAERELQRGRSLQGGYSPNMAAAQVKMAREQGQSGADAMQNVEAGLAQMRNEGRRFGLTGMGNIEGQRLNADVDISKFNTGLDFQGQTYNADAMAQAQARNIGAGESAAGRASNASAANMSNRLDALQGARMMYGTTPGMSQTFGDQLNTSINQGGSFGLGLYGHDINAQARPGQFDQTMGRAQNIATTIGTIANPILEHYRQQRQQQPTGYNLGTGYSMAPAPRGR